jgi:hypothetical protein
MDDLSPFEGSLVLLDQAKAGIADLDAQVARFIGDNAYTIVRRTDNKAGEDVLSYKFQKRLPPEMRYLASRITQEIKHALDQALCDAAVELGRPDKKSIHFPIGGSQLDFARQIKDHCKNVHPTLLNIIEGFQPHSCGDTLLYSFLRLAGPAKHQELLTLSNASDGCWIYPWENPRVVLPSGTKILAGDHWSQSRNTLDFLRIPQGADYKLNLRPALLITIQQRKPPFGDAATVIMQTCLAKAHEVVAALQKQVLETKQTVVAPTL